MTETQKVIKYLAMGFAIFLIVAIIGGILTCLSFASYVFTDNETVSVGELSDYSVSNVDRLYIDLQAADLEIRSGFEFSLQSNHEYLKVDESSDSLKIEEVKRPYRLNEIAYKVVLTVPANAVLDSVTIKTGAGKLTLDGFNTEALKLTLGAGAVTLNKVTATENTDFEGGAGEITITDCTFADLDMKIGVSACHLTATLIGDSEIDCGVGEADLKLIRTPQNDYSITVKKALGDVTLDGQSIKNDETIGFGENEVEINCGVGSVAIELLDR